MSVRSLEVGNIVKVRRGAVEVPTQVVSVPKPDVENSKFRGFMNSSGKQLDRRAGAEYYDFVIEDVID